MLTFVTLKKKIKVIRCHFRNGNNRWHISKYLKVLRAFLRYLSSFQIYTHFKILTFKKVNVTGYNFRIETIRWQMTKSTHLSHTSLRYRLPFQMYTSRSRSRIFAMLQFNGKFQNLQISTTRFGASSCRFRCIKILKNLPLNSRFKFVYFVLRCRCNLCYYNPWPLM